MLVGILPIGRIAGYVELYSVPDDSDAQSVLELPVECDGRGNGVEDLLGFLFNGDDLITLGVA